MINAVIKFFLTICTIIIYLILSISSTLAEAKITSLTGVMNHQVFKLTYLNGEKNLKLRVRNSTILFPIFGYAENFFIVKDLDHDGNDEIVFLDVTGQAVGGDLRLLNWTDHGIKENEEEYTASMVKVEKIKNKLYLIVFQHDTEKLFYVSNILELNNSHLRDIKEKDIWNKIIINYLTNAKQTRKDWESSRYYAYAYLAYTKIGMNLEANLYYSKAKNIDPLNPFLR